MITLKQKFIIILIIILIIDIFIILYLLYGWIKGIDSTQEQFGPIDFQASLALANGSFIGIDSNNILVTTPSLNSSDTWKSIGRGYIKNIIQLQNGSFVGIGINNTLFTTPSLNSYDTWKSIGRGYIKNIIQLQNGSFVGIGIDNTLFTTPSLNSSDTWKSIGRGWIKNIIQLQNGSFIGIGANNTLFTTPSLNLSDTWKSIGRGYITNIIQLQNGSFIGIGIDNTLFTTPSLNPSDTWKSIGRGWIKNIIHLNLIPTTTPPAITTTPPAITIIPPAITTISPKITTTSLAITTISPEITTTPPAITTILPKITTTSLAITTTPPEITTIPPEITTTPITTPYVPTIPQSVINNNISLQNNIISQLTNLFSLSSNQLTIMEPFKSKSNFVNVQTNLPDLQALNNIYDKSIALADDPNNYNQVAFDTYIHLQNNKINELQSNLNNITSQIGKTQAPLIKAFRNMANSQILNLEGYPDPTSPNNGQPSTYKGNDATNYPNYLIYGNNGCLSYNSLTSTPIVMPTLTPSTTTNLNTISSNLTDTTIPNSTTTQYNFGQQPSSANGSWSFKSCNATDKQQQFYAKQINTITDYNTPITNLNNSNYILNSASSTNMGFYVINPINASDQCLQLNGDGLSVMPCNMDSNQRFKPMYKNAIP